MTDNQTVSRLIELLSEPTFLVDGQQRVIALNHMLSELLGYPSGSLEEMMNSPLEIFLPGFTDLLLRDGGDFQGVLVTREGEVGVCGCVMPMQGEFSLIRVLPSHDTQEAGSSVFHRQRLETLGMLAGGVAHDFNNVLAGILGHITYLKTILPGTGDHCESLQAIEDGARKASLMTKQILDFSKLDLEERPVSLNLTEIVEGVFRLLKGATSPRIVLDLYTPEEAVHVLGVEGKVAQIIVNLVINARDAIDADGTIHVNLKRVENSEDLLEIFGGEELSAPAYALLEVRDSGHGMSQDVLDRIFEPYFSTKDGKGTGLGLATVLSIVKQLAGAIDIASEEGNGTTVSVYLPLVHQDEASPQDSRTASPLQRGSERVLIVDDEYPVRNVIAMSLGHLGYEVETVSSGVEALVLFEEEGKRYDLMILDMLMPKLSGEEVFRRVREIDPMANVLVISGYSSEAAVDEILANGGKGFIQKPFTIDELSLKVRECLDGEA